MLIIGSQELECISFRVRYGLGDSIARRAALPVAVEQESPRAIEATLKGGYAPSRAVDRLHWNQEFVGWFVLTETSQEWDGDKYRVRLTLKEVAAPDRPPIDDVPLYKWRHDLLALSRGLKETDGAALVAGHKVEAIAPSWKKDSL